tara:strand:+ start:3263 stop:4519 length:1257 start_codon:yes stop_codon:yes gene_type:complete
MKKKILILILLFTIIKVEAQTSTFSTIDSLFEKGRYQLALAAFDTIQSNSFLTNYKKAIIYESIDNYTKTIQFLEKALLYKEDDQAKYKLAKAYQKLNKIEKSIKIHETLLAKDSMNLILKYQLGKLYLATKKVKKAVLLFKDLIKKDKNNANYSYRLGLSYALMNKRDPMIDSFIDTYKKDTTHLKAIAHLASSFYKLKDNDSTKLFVDKGLTLDENHINLNRLKINRLYKEKKYEQTLPYLLKQDRLHKMEVYNNSMLGKVYFKLEKLDSAKIRFRNVGKIDREDFKSLTYLGHIAMQQKEYKTAFFYYLTATKNGKKKRDAAFFGLATMYYETNKPKLAIVNFKKAYQENYKNDKALYQLAKLSDDFYKEKKIGYKHYVRYLERFEDRDEEITAFVKNRIQAIKKEYFISGKSLE